ncbi:MAG TPA: glucosamine-6-phosphate deaminase [Verrucomicrobia bacterium]|jgi:glucosamine-6-phosphate deaminase|nr:glucosamine-6-phosphate deaminase [Verrucomicrobiota bacterium]
MEVHVLDDKQAMGMAAARAAAEGLNRAFTRSGKATLILATGASQFEMLDALVSQKVDWSKVTLFHLDEYVGLPATHPASFRGYLQQRFVERVPRLGAFHPVQADEGDPQAECHRVGALIRGLRVDVACVGIGENGHLAFNDPPADFETLDPYLVVELDEACRRQQVGEGWFGALAEVPRSAISMSIRQILKSATIVCTVPDARKAVALKQSLKGPVTPDVPASILQMHPDCHIFTDTAGGALLEEGK